MKKKIIVPIVLILFIIVGYFIIDSPKVTDYESVMNEILDGEPVESLTIIDYQNNPKGEALTVTDQETIKKMIEKPRKTKIKGTDDYSVDRYSISIKTKNQDFTLMVGENNIIRFVGVGEELELERFYAIEGENVFLPIVEEITKQ